MARLPTKRAVVLCLSTLLAAGCGDGGDTTAIGGTGGTGGSGGDSASAGGGADSSGGSSAACAPGAQQPCYTGPSDTEGVGVCSAGVRMCLEDGSGFGDCVGEITPVAETCNTPDDEDCDGEANESGAGCVCVPGTTESCYTGPEGTEGVGLCIAGTATCHADGQGYGDCEGDVTPTVETCSVIGDDDCDGKTNEDGADCLCNPGSIQSCYSADPATLGVGLCSVGSQVCNADSLGWGPCNDEVTPVAETCSTPDDDDCDGEANEEGSGCVCAPDSVSACYTGPAGTEGVGICAAGEATCNDQGTLLGPCLGEVTPATETCDTPNDDDCDGEANEEGAGCVCLPNTASSCPYSGPPGTDGVGTCVAGTATCNEEGTVLGPCTGEIVPTFDSCATVADEDCDGGSLICTGNQLWSKRFGDASTLQAGRSVASDAAGNVIVTGYFTGTVDFGGGPLTSVGGGDVFIAKRDAAGNPLWSRRFGDESNYHNVSGATVATDAAGNVLVAGYFTGTTDFGGGPLTSTGNSNVFLVKLDAAGNHLWSKRFGGSTTAESYSVATDPAGNVVVTGSFGDTIDFGGGPLVSVGVYDIFITKLDPSGNHLWSKRFGDTSGYGARVATDAAGNVAVTGNFDGTVDFGGGPLTSAGGGDIFLTKFDAAGMHLWSKRFGDADIQDVSGLSTDATGNQIMAGRFRGTVDFGGGPTTSAVAFDIFVAKLDAAGNHVWSKRFGDASGHQMALGVATDATGNVVVTGNFYGTVDFGGGPLVDNGGSDAFLAKLDPSANHLWSKRLGNGNKQTGYSVATDAAHNVVVTGEFEGTIDFGGGPLTSAGGGDVFVAKLAP